MNQQSLEGLNTAFAMELEATHHTEVLEDMFTADLADEEGANRFYTEAVRAATSG